MPATRIMMPNGTTRSFHEGTPKSVIRQAKADMLAEMKASGEYEGVDLRAIEKNLTTPTRHRMEVTQFSSPFHKTGAIDKLRQGDIDGALYAVGKRWDTFPENAAGEHISKGAPIDIGPLKEEYNRRLR